MRFLLLTSAEKGQLNPMTGVAQWLIRDGHPVGGLTIPEPVPRRGAARVRESYRQRDGAREAARQIALMARA